MDTTKKEFGISVGLYDMIRRSFKEAEEKLRQSVETIDKKDSTVSKWYYEKGEADKISSTRRALVKLNGVSLIAKARKRVADATTALTSAMSCMDKVQSLDQKIAQTMSGSEPNDDGTETDSDANPTIQAAIKGLNDLEKECVERITLCEATVNGIAPFIKAFDNQWQEEVESCLVSDDQLAKKLGEADERTYTSTYTRALSFIYPDETGTHEGQIPTSSVWRGFIRATINGYIVLHALDNSLELTQETARKMKDRIKNQFVEKGPTIDDDAWKMTATKRHEELSHLFCGRIVD